MLPKKKLQKDYICGYNWGGGLNLFSHVDVLYFSGSLFLKTISSRALFQVITTKTMFTKTSSLSFFNSTFITKVFTLSSNMAYVVDKWG